jgi:nucleoid DNA-binding protein
MNKNELVSAVADAASISKSDAQSAVDAVFSVITGELKSRRSCWQIPAAPQHAARRLKAEK